MKNVASTKDAIGVINGNVQPHVAAVEEEGRNGEALLEVALVAGLPVLMYVANDDKADLGNVAYEDCVGAPRESGRQAKLLCNTEGNLDNLLPPVSRAHES